MVAGGEGRRLVGRRERKADRFHGGGNTRRRSVGRAWRRARTRKQRKVPETGRTPRPLRSRREEGDRGGSGTRRRRAKFRDGRQRSALRSGEASPADECLLHDELPRADRK